MPVPMICTEMPGCIGIQSSSSIASEYASWPLEHAADQIVSPRDGGSVTSGSRCWVNVWNGCESRNHEVSLVVNASTTASLSRSSP
jgi:hypothetical protein